MVKQANGKWVNYTGHRFYLCRNRNNWLKFNVDQVFCHPKHNGLWYSGHDYAIAVVSLSDYEGSSFDTDHYASSRDIKINSKACFLTSQDAEKAKDCNCMIAGYPGYPEKKDKEKRGQAVLGTGKILKIEETETGGYIVHYNMNTRSGMSGSPIFANDPNFYQIVDQALGKGNYLLTERESVHITDPKRALFGFGVHTGGAPGGKANIGTLLTPEIEAWELAQLNSYGLAGHYCTSIEANEQEPWIAPLQALIVKSPPKQPPAQDQMVVNSLMTISGKSRESCISALEAAQNQPNLAI